MKNYQGINVETKSILNKVMNKFALTLHAEEPPKVEEPPKESTEGENNTPKINYEDLVAKARKEEKDKLYKQMQTKDARINDLVEKNNNLMLKVGELESEKLSLKKDLDSAKEGGAKFESDEITKLTKEKEDLAKEVLDLKNSTVDRKVIEDEIKGEYEVKMYRLQKLQEVGNAVIPELVSGDTKESIDASLEIAKQRYADIVGSVVPQGTSKPNIPTGNPSTGEFNISSIKPEDVASMSPKQWAEYRKTIGLQ